MIRKKESVLTLSYLFYFAHPAQFMFARQTVSKLRQTGQSVHILIRRKDVLEDLVRASGLPYENILPEERGQGRLSMLFSLLKRNVAMIGYLRRNKINVLIGTDASLAQVGRLFGKKTITILEDDYDIIKQLARITYPFTSYILTPHVCDTGPYSAKKIGYSGYMKLAYLGPNQFSPDRKRVKLPEDKPYVLIRLSALQAHHDKGVGGISDDVLQNVIKMISEKYAVYISSEKALRDEYEPYRLVLDPSDMHHYLNYASFFISDSQSMSVEAALLGVPSIRVSDFMGRISVLNELEDNYQLTHGVKPHDTEALFGLISAFVNDSDLKEKYMQRREQLLKDKIDVSAFFTWFLKNFPESVDQLEKNPKLEFEFRLR